MNAMGIFVIEAEDLSLDELPSDSPLPPATVTWPDGRVNELPQFDENGSSRLRPFVLSVEIVVPEGVLL